MSLPLPPKISEQKVSLFNVYLLSLCRYSGFYRVHTELLIRLRLNFSHQVNILNNEWHLRKKLSNDVVLCTVLFSNWVCFCCNLQFSWICKIVVVAVEKSNVQVSNMLSNSSAKFKINRCHRQWNIFWESFWTNLLQRGSVTWMTVIPFIWIIIIWWFICA